MADIRREPGQASPIGGPVQPVDRSAELNLIKGLGDLGLEGLKAYGAYQQKEKAAQEASDLSAFRQNLQQAAPLIDDASLSGATADAKRLSTALAQGASPSTIRNKRIKLYREFTAQHPESASEAAKIFEIEAGQSQGKELQQAIDYQTGKMAEQQAQAFQDYYVKMSSTYNVDGNSAEGKSKILEIDSEKAKFNALLGVITSYEQVQPLSPEKLQEVASGTVAGANLIAYESARDIESQVKVGDSKDPASNSSPEAVQEAIRQLRLAKQDLYNKSITLTKGKLNAQQINTLYGTAFEKFDNAIERLQTNDENTYKILENRDKLDQLLVKQSILDTPEKKKAYSFLVNVMGEMRNQDVINVLLNNPKMSKFFVGVFETLYGNSSGRPVANPMTSPDLDVKDVKNFSDMTKEFMKLGSAESQEMTRGTLETFSKFTDNDLSRLSTDEVYAFMDVAADPNFLKYADETVIPEQFNRILTRGKTDMTRALMSKLGDFTRKQDEFLPARPSVFQNAIGMTISEDGKVAFKVDQRVPANIADQVAYRNIVKELNANYAPSLNTLIRVNSHVNNNNDYYGSAGQVIGDLGQRLGFNMLSYSNYKPRESDSVGGVSLPSYPLTTVTDWNKAMGDIQELAKDPSKYSKAQQSLVEKLRRDNPQLFMQVTDQIMHEVLNGQQE